MTRRKFQGDRAYQPAPRECAMLLLKLIEVKQQETGKEVTRTRLSESTLRRLWCRGRLPADFVQEVQEWLLMAGWVLFFAGSTYALIRAHAVHAWMRISSKRLAEEIADVQRGQFDFTDLEPFLLFNIETTHEGDDSE